MKSSALKKLNLYSPAESSSSNLIKIGEASQLIGVSIDTLRRWEKRGWLRVTKTPGGTRLYDKAQLLKLNPNVKRGPKVSPLFQSLPKEQIYTSPTTSLFSQATSASQIHLNSDLPILKTSKSIERDQIESEINTSFSQTPNQETNSSLFTFSGSTLDSLKRGVQLCIVVLLLTLPLVFQTNYVKNNQTISSVLSLNPITNNQAYASSDLFKKLSTIFSPTLSHALYGKYSAGSPPGFFAKLNTKNSDQLASGRVSGNIKGSNFARSKGDVLADSTPSGSFLQINLDTQINGSLSVDTASVSAQLYSATINTGFGDNEVYPMDQPLLTTSEVTFGGLSLGTLTLTSTSNQLRLGNTIVSTQTGGSGAFTVSIPTLSSNGNFVIDNASQTLTNKSISGSDNTLTNIPISALSSSSITINAGSGLSGGGAVSLGGSITLSASGTGVTSITGTSNQIIASASTGDITLSLPQNIALTSNPTFAGLDLTGSTSGTVNLTANSVTTDYNFVLPGDDGTSGYVLETDGLGNTSWVAQSGGATTLQEAYDGGNTITTSTGRNIAYTLASGLATSTSLTLTNAGTANALILNDTNAATNTSIDIQSGGVSSLTITEAGTLATSGNISTSGSGTITSASTLTASNGLTMTTGALSLTSTSGAISSTGLTGLTYTLSSGTAAITAPTLNLNTASTGNTAVGNATGTFALTSNGGLNVTTGGALTGVASIDTIAVNATSLTFAGAGTISSTTTAALTLDSGTTGTVNLGTGNNAKTINLGTGNAGNTINIGTNNSVADAINIGSALDTTILAGTVRVSGLSVSSAVYTDGSSNLTSTAPTSGTIGYWSRSGTTLSPATAGDAVTTSGNISTSSTGAITSAGTLTASNGFTMTTGALSLTSTSGAISSTGLTALTYTLSSGTAAITAPTLNLNTASTGNTAIGNTTGTFALTSNGGLNVTTGGALTGVASIDTISTSATAITFAGTGTLGATSTALNLQADGAIDVNIAGGSGATGCTIANSTGDLTCTGNITGSGSGTAGFWSRTSTTLSPATANDIVSIANTNTTGADLAVINTGVYTGTGIFNLTANSATTGTVETISATGLTTGKVQSISATNTATTNTAITQALYSLTNAQSTLANSSFVGLGLNFTNNPSIAGNTEYAFQIQNQLTANITDNVVSALLRLDNADTVTTGSTVVTNGLLITNSGGLTGGFTNGITVGSGTDSITTGLNLASTGITTDISLQNAETIDNDTDGIINFAVSATSALKIGSTGISSIGNVAHTIVNSSGSLAIDSNSTGALNIGTGANAKTITIGNSTSSTALAFTSGTGSQTFTSSVATGTTTSSAFVFNASSLSSGTALRVTSTSTSGKLADLNATNTSGTIFNLAYGASTTLAGDTYGLVIDLNSGTVVATNQNLTGVNFKIPTVTNTITTGTKTLTGMLVNFGTGAGISQTGIGGTTEYIAGDFQLPALTQSAGTLNAYGTKVTTPATITTGGTAYGHYVSATGVGAGTLSGLGISAITGGAGIEYALNIGTGWDAVLRVGSTTVINGSGITQVVGGGTGLATVTQNGILYGNAASNLGVTAEGATGQVLIGNTGGAPSWGTISGSTCTNCLVNNPSSTQTIAPTGAATQGLSIRQTSTALGGNTQDIFNVTSSDGLTKYFYVDYQGNVSSGSISNTNLTITPTTNSTALTLLGTNVTSAKNQYINTKNSSGTIFDLSYGAAQSLAGTVIGHNVDLSTNVTATNQSVSGYVMTLPAATNTSGTQNYKGLVLTGGALNSNTGNTAINYYGADITIPAITQTAGTLTAYGIQIDTPSSITTGGTAYGLQVNASGVGAGTLSGIDITAITPGAGTETGLAIGSGWDTNLLLNDTTARVGLANGGTLTIVDTAGNSLCTITDAGSVGNLDCTGTIGGTGSVGFWSRDSGTGIVTPSNANDIVAISTNKVTGTALALTSSAVTTAGSAGFTNTTTVASTAGGVPTYYGINNTLTNSNSTNANNPIGIYSIVQDSTALANTVYGSQSIARSDGNAAKNLYGIYGRVISTSTTGDSLVAGLFNTFASGALASGSRSIYGVQMAPATTAASTANTQTIYGFSSTPSSTGSGPNITDTVANVVYGGYISTTLSLASDCAGNCNSTQYGLYVDNGTSSTNGTSTKYGIYLNTQSGADTNYALYSAATAASYFAGNVGIGTTTPQANLSFATASADKIRLYGTTATANYGIGIASGNTQLYVPTASGFVSINAGGDLQTAGTNEIMRIMGTGNVGIGTTAPGAKLQVVGDAYIGDGTAITQRVLAVLGDLTTTSGTNQTAEVHLPPGPISTYTDGPGLVGYKIGTGASVALRDYGLKLQVTDSNTALTAMTILNDGNVGIGTTTPAATLQVTRTNTNAAYDVVKVGNSTYQSGTNFTKRILSLGDIAVTGSFDERVDLRAVDIGDISYTASNYIVGAQGARFYGYRMGNLTITGTPYNDLVSYGFYMGGINSPSNGGGFIPTNYGMYLGNVTGTGSNNYSIYSAGGTMYHSGNVGIGTVDNSLAKLMVYDTADTKLILADSDTGANGVTNLVRMSFRANWDSVNIYSKDSAGIEAGITPTTGYSNQSSYLMFYTSNNTVGSAIERMRIDKNGNVGIGDTTPTEGLLTILSASNTTPGLSFTDSTATTLGNGANTTGVLDLQSTTLTTGNFMNLEVNALTTGKALNISGPTSTGVTGNFVNLTSDVGSAGSLLKLAPDFSGAGVVGYGANITATDSTANANTDYGYYAALTLTGNAAKAAYGISTSISSNSTTADSLYGGIFSTTNTGNAVKSHYGIVARSTSSNTTGDGTIMVGALLDPSVTGALTTAIAKNAYGLISSPTSTGNSTAGVIRSRGLQSTPSSSGFGTSGNSLTSEVMGLFVSPTNDPAADCGASCLSNTYGVYVENGTTTTEGTSTKYGIYIAAQSGSDTNYGLYTAGGTNYMDGSTGTLMVGTTTNSNSSNMVIHSTPATTGSGLTVWDPYSADAVGRTSVFFRRNASNVGGISMTDTTTTYSTTSDRRLKENITESSTGLDDLMKIGVTDFNFKSDSEKKRMQGYIAQDLYKIYPYAVSTNGSAGEGPVTDTTQWSVDYGRITPLIVRSVQQLNQKVENALLTINPNGTTNTNLNVEKITVSGDAKIGGLVSASNFALDANLLNRSGAMASVPVSGNKVSLADSVNALNNQTTANTNALSQLELEQASQSAELAQARILGEQAVNHAKTLDEKVASTSANLSSLSSRIDDLLASISGNTPEATSSPLPEGEGQGEGDELNLTPPNLLIATDSAVFANLDVTENLSTLNLEALDATISSTFKSLGETFLGQTTIAGDLSVDGTLSFTNGNSINAFPTLFFQNNPLASAVDFFNGKITLNKDGALAAESLALGDQSLGTATIAAGQTEITIPSSLITPNSKIFITPESALTGNLYVAQKVEDSGFKVRLSEPNAAPVKFNWMIIQTKEAAN